ncbi:hypothetical protein [Chitinophaga pinensis]|uniref:Uncharacterized protein n=1 Tax=Chitinophaga pinensis TaxID=79329 RepID=A0A5C6LP19_9BACT|nr:hypothetical protein [Chitinophaga pinensis]TWV98932.1 hypothetical protein FEF09_18795 [Chitinophaga pinensis]
MPDKKIPKCVKRAGIKKHSIAVFTYSTNRKFLFLSMEDMLFEKNAGVMYCNFDIYQAEEAALKERRRAVAQGGHKGLIYDYPHLMALTWDITM